MVEQLGALIGVLFIFSKIVGVIKSLMFAEQYLAKLASRPLTDREAIIFDHIFSEHDTPLRECHTSACVGLA